MRICIGSDHAGYELKTAVKSHLLALGHEVEDLGTYEPQVSVDYPDYGRRVAQQVAAGAGERGIVICGTGIGVSIAANKVHGIRAALCTDSYMARMARLHNDANVLALGGRVVGVGLALDIVDAFLTTAFEGGRHSSRVEKLMALESEP
ncbi:MAG TPA: ribose 5-phosphate isomerase B [Anaerolineae bacterium]|nr:ribose 5-phosphate isomerase B [Anaerolineae bacterium]HOV48052.1 ribose 5-phosphate isomerase B [Anaerolineae bacterium]HPD41533.1 ribose 5-phosphate isomerase B [Anaerolineae bacterium]HRU94852.1 ribose 5-phosphate isomerase B [Anaerolineae bacterium]HXK42717.1 ribose 5-phosphate isomerase B [Anaerolineae bacterium]